MASGHGGGSLTARIKLVCPECGERLTAHILYAQGNQANWALTATSHQHLKECSK